MLELHEEEKTRQIIETRTLESLTVDQKVALFKQLFKGRADVFATRWQNSKGRSGYSVACHNEWVPGICKKPDIKCIECPNRQHKALDDQAIYDHLAGKHIVGLYPLLPDNTCHLLAADFDQDGWQDAVKAMSEACRRWKSIQTFHSSLMTACFPIRILCQMVALAISSHCRCRSKSGRAETVNLSIKHWSLSSTSGNN